MIGYKVLGGKFVAPTHTRQRGPNTNHVSASSTFEAWKGEGKNKTLPSIDAQAYPLDAARAQEGLITALARHNGRTIQAYMW